MTSPAWTRVIWTGVGGLLAVGLPDERRVVVASHAGVGVYDGDSGHRIARTYDNDYAWWDAERGAILLPVEDGHEVVPCMGLEGGALPTRTSEGWTFTRSDIGAILRCDSEQFTVHDDEEFRAAGFSPGGTLFAFATSPNLTVLRRAQQGE